MSKSTWKEIVETVLRRPAGGDISVDFSVEESEVCFRGAQMIPFIIRKDFWETYQIEQEIVDATQFTTFIAKIFTDDLSGERYLLLPSAPLLLNGRGTPQVSYLKDRKHSVTYVEASQINILHGAEIVPELGDYCFYEYFNDSASGTHEHRLVFGSLGDDPDQLRVRLIQTVDMEEFDMYAAVPLAPHLIEVLIQQLTAWYSGTDKEAKDVVNDGNNNSKNV